MERTKLSYKGKDIDIEYTDDEHAKVTIEGRTFDMVLHEGNLRMWSCDESYFMAPDLIDVAKHMVDYWYIITDPNTAPPEGGHGHGGGHEHPGGHAHGGGAGKKSPTRGGRAKPAPRRRGGGG